jgi:oligosaccharide repeat unit polymerase
MNDSTIKRPKSSRRLNFGVELLLLPSFYGIIGWSAALGVYLISPYDQKFLPETWGIIAYTLVLFVLSIVIFLLSARESLNSSELKFDLRVEWTWFIAAVIIGGFGLYLYVRDFSSYFGGISGFISTLTQSSLDVRGAAQEVGGLGFQISYASWVAVFFGLIMGWRAPVLVWQRVMLLSTSLVLFILNLMFVDRTRPIWIMVVCLFGFITSRRTQDIKPMQAIAYVGGIPLTIFFVFAIISGKFDVSAGVLDNFIIYVTGGIGYFDSLVAEVTSSQFTGVQTFLPVTKTLKAIGVLDYAPSEILDFRMVPFATNVGTFLQPLFADGGWPMLIFGLPVLVFCTDWMALACFRTQTLMGRFFWANLTFTMLISFFVPKFNNTATYVFFILLIIDQVRPSVSKRDKLSAIAS